jgi:hypothetical protein
MATRLEILEKWHLLRPYLDRRQRILWAATEAEAGIIEDWRRDTLGPTRTGPVAFRRIVDFGALIEEVRFAEDSPLEGAGFEPSAPESRSIQCSWDCSAFCPPPRESERLVGSASTSGRRQPAGKLPRLQPLFDHIQQALPDEIPFRGSEPAKRPLCEQHGQPAHRGPRQVFRTWATLGRQHTGFDEPVERRAQQLKGIEPAISGLSRNGSAARFIGDREGGMEQSRFFLCKPQVSGANRSQARTSEVGGTVSVEQLRQLGLHRDGQRRQGGRADRLQELRTAGEMPIRGIGHHARVPGGFAQYDRVGPAGARQLDPRFDQRASEVAVAIRAAFRGTRCCVGHDFICGHRPFRLL